jgi:hypothetical protein
MSVKLSVKVDYAAVTASAAARADFLGFFFGDMSSILKIDQWRFDTSRREPLAPGDSFRLRLLAQGVAVDFDIKESPNNAGASLATLKAGPLSSPAAFAKAIASTPGTKYGALMDTNSLVAQGGGGDSAAKLSGGAIAGIVVGCLAFVVIVAVLVWHFGLAKKCSGSCECGECGECGSCCASDDNEAQRATHQAGKKEIPVETLKQRRASQAARGGKATDLFDLDEDHADYDSKPVGGKHDTETVFVDV